MASRARTPARRLSSVLIAVGICCLAYVGWNLLELAGTQSWERYAFESRRRGHEPTRSGYLASFLRRELSPPPPVAGPALPPLELPGDRDPTSALDASRPPPSPGDTLGLIRIDRLGLDVVVKEGVDDATLRVAAGHIPQTPLPGGAGNVGIAAHRDTLFRPVRNIRLGDRVRLETEHGAFDYDVDATAIVDPTDVAVLAAREHPSLTLVTCWPFDFRGAAPYRFIVHARQVASPGAER